MLQDDTHDHRHDRGSVPGAVPDPAFMILVFAEPVLKGVSGVTRYRDEFDRGM